MFAGEEEDLSPKPLARNLKTEFSFIMDNNRNNLEINDLPPELLEKIFHSYLESEGIVRLCCILTKVCKLWKKVVMSPTFWTKVHLTSNDIVREPMHQYMWLKDREILRSFTFTKDLCYVHDPVVVFEAYCSSSLRLDEAYGLDLIIQNCSRLEKFTCISNKELSYSPEIVTFPQFSPLIKELCFGSNLGSLKTSDVFSNLIKRHGANLIKLVLQNMNMKPNVLLELSRKIGERCGGLIHLEIDICSGEQRFDLNAVQSGCPNMKKLTLKNVLYSESDDSVPRLCFPSLKEFSFKSPSLEIEYDPEMILNCTLRGSKNLEKLQLIDIDFLSGVTLSLLNLPFSDLKELSVRCFGLQPGLYEVLCRWKDSLIKLDVTCNEDVRDSVFQFIEEHGKLRLEFLSLRCCIDVLRLKGLVFQCKKLRYLRFYTYTSLMSEQKILSNPAEITQWMHS